MYTWLDFAASSSLRHLIVTYPSSPDMVSNREVVFFQPGHWALRQHSGHGVRLVDPHLMRGDSGRREEREACYYMKKDWDVTDDENASKICRMENQGGE